jgi:uncharacterized protein (TIGR03000 family)
VYASPGNWGPYYPRPAYVYPRFYDGGYYFQSYQPAPPRSALPQESVAAARSKARISVSLPEPDAEVWFDGKKTSSRGDDRLFETPALEPGATPTYTVTATWRQNGRPVTQTRTVKAVAGGTSVVDFTRPADAP